MNAPANTVSPITRDNPIGTNGFEFVEYSAPSAEGIEELRALFNRMGFTETRKHRSKQVFLFQQENVNFVLNAEPDSHAAEFAKVHGPVPAPWRGRWPTPSRPSSMPWPTAPRRWRTR